MAELSPPDAEVALRSLARRFRAAVAAAASDDDSGDDLANRAGPDGESVLGHVSAVTRGLSTLDHALERVLTTDDAILDETRRSDPVSTTKLGLDEALLDLEITAGTMADRVRGTRAEGWTRSGTVVGSDQPVQAIDLVRRAVADSIDRLKAAEQTLKAVRRS